MNTALATLLSHPAIWRGNDCAPEPATLPSGFAALDAALPGRGWPQGALTEVLLEREGIGELRLTLPALAGLQAQGQDVVWVAPPHRPYAPALAAAGLDLARFYVVRCPDPKDALWAYEQALRAPECGAAFAWLAGHDERVLRRLQVAAREGHTWGVLWRRPGQRASATAAPLRLGLSAHFGKLSVRVLKRRGAELPQPVMIDLATRASALPCWCMEAEATRAAGEGTALIPNPSPASERREPSPLLSATRRGDGGVARTVALRRAPATH